MIRFTPHMLLAAAALAAATPAAAVNIFDIEPNVTTLFHITGTGTIDTAYTRPYTSSAFFIDAVGAELTVDVRFEVYNMNDPREGRDIYFSRMYAVLKRSDNGATWGTETTHDINYLFDEPTAEGPLLLTNVQIRDYNDWWGMALEMWALGGDFTAMTNPLILDQPGGYLDPDAGLGVVWGTWGANFASVTPFGGETRQYAGPNLELVRPPVTPGIPEPASWALLIAGFGLVGASFRRQRRERCA